MKKPPPPEEKGEQAPLWIISFADMISLLMAFFVMLLTMATAKSGMLCNDGMGVFEHSIGGFRKAVSGFGVPELFGSGDEALDFQSVKAHYALKNPDEPPARRTIDAHEEKIRRVFNQIDSRARTARPQLTGSSPEFTVAPISFAPMQSTLDAKAQAYLAQYTAALAAGSFDGLTIYVVGLAPGEQNIRDQWVMSAKRSQVVADTLRSHLPAGSKTRVFAWGAATGGDWTGTSGPAPKQAFILIATLHPEKR
jgi:hypothetical protein